MHLNEKINHQNMYNTIGNPPINPRDEIIELKNKLQQMEAHQQATNKELADLRVSLEQRHVQVNVAIPQQIHYVGGNDHFPRFEARHPQLFRISSGSRHPVHKLYAKRWLMLFIFVIFVFNVSYQGFKFPTLHGSLRYLYYKTRMTNFMKFTKVVLDELSFTRILLIPFLILINLKGTKFTMALGALGVMITDYLKLLSVSPDRLILSLIAEWCLSFFQPLTYGLIARFAADWFGICGISTTVALGLLADELGNLTLYFPRFSFIYHESNERIEKELKIFYFILAIISTFIFLLILFIFQSKPKIPPSISQFRRDQLQRKTFFQNLLGLVKNLPFVLFVCSFALNYSLSHTIRNEVFRDFMEFDSLRKFQAVTFVGGFIGAISLGILLDVTRSYKTITNFSTIGNLILIILLLLPWHSNDSVFTLGSVFLFGFFSFGYYSTAIQLAIELTYPIPEEISVGICYIFARVLRLALSVGFSIIRYNFPSILLRNSVIIFCIIVVVIVTLLIPSRLKRQQVENEHAT